MAYQPPFILVAQISGSPALGASGLCTLNPFYDPTGILGDSATSFDLPTGMYLATVWAVGDAAAAGTLSLTLENSSDVGQSISVAATVTGAGPVVPGLVDGQAFAQFFLMGLGDRTVDLAYTNDTGLDMNIESSLLTIVRVA